MSPSGENTAVAPLPVTDEEIASVVQESGPDTRPKDIPIEHILELHEKGLSNAQIAKLLGCNPSNITKRLQHHEIDLKRTRHYVKNRAERLASLQVRVLDGITEKDIKRAQLNQKVSAVKNLYEMERLETGQSTANIDHHLSTQERQGLEQLAAEWSQRQLEDSSVDE
jgi:hypothetical protein